MQIVDEQKILDQNYRAQVIQMLEGNDNARRKQHQLKRRDLFKDKTYIYVKKSLESHGLKPETVSLMMARSGNISLLRKAITKLARTYKNGVTRIIEDVDPAVIEEIERLLNYDQKQKKVDKYLELYKNCISIIIPERQHPGESWAFKKKVLAPWQYDVLSDEHDNESMKVLILSDVKSKESKRYIWWSDSYHFTTDAKGAVIPSLSPDDLLNPIGMLPAVNYAINQDGEFWAQGGDDLVEGSVLVNVLLTDMFSIAYQQGWGQMVIVGKIDDSKVKIGPHHAMILDYDKDEDAKPEVSVINSNPPLDMWMNSIEQYVALLLSTNSLSPTTVSNKLDATSFPSGISQLIEMSEATNDIEDKQKMYRDNELKDWRIYSAWHNNYLTKGLLADDWAVLGLLPEYPRLSVKFNDSKAVISEKEKMEILKARKELGINEMIDLIKIDDPGLTTEQAEEKLQRILEEKVSSFGKAIRDSAAAQDESKKRFQEVIDGNT